MRPRYIAVLLLTMSITAPVLAQEKNKNAAEATLDFLKVIPADALVVVIPNQERAEKRLNTLKDAIEYTQFNLTGEAAMGILRGFMGFNDGVNKNSSLIAVSIDPERMDENTLAFGTGIGDLKKILTAYGLEPKDVADGKITQATTFSGWTSNRNFITVRGKYLWLSPSRDTLEKVIKLEPLHDRLSPARRAELTDVGLMIHVGARVFDDEEKSELSDTLRKLFGGTESGKQALVAAQHFHSAQAIFSLTDGLRTGLQINFDGSQEAEDSLDLLFGDGESNVVGLPDGDVLVAGALHGTADGTAALMSDMNWNPLSHSSLLAIDPSTISGLFGDLAAHVDNTTVGWYLNKQSEDNGTMSLISILTPADSPDALVKEIKSLSTFVNARTARDLRIRNEPVDEEEIAALIKQLGAATFRERHSAQTKLTIIGQPALPALAAAAESENQDIAQKAGQVSSAIRNSMARRQRRAMQKNPLADLEPQFLFRKNGRDPNRPLIEVLLKPSQATTQLNQQFTALFGAGWKRLRLAVLKEHVVILFGSDTDLLERTIAQIERGAIPKELRDTIQSARTTFKGQRLGEWYFSLPSVTNASYGKFKKSADADELLSTVTFLRRKGQIRTDIQLPMKQIQAAFEAERARRGQ